jgi:predicted peptidase
MFQKGKSVPKGQRGDIALENLMAARISVGQSAKRFRQEIRKVVSLRYQLFLPSKYVEDRNRSWPLMLFLHGAGERGSDIERVKKHGPPKLVGRRKAFPFIVVSPQCPEGERWKPDALTALLDDVVSRYRIDEDRVYVTGLSLADSGRGLLQARIPVDSRRSLRFAVEASDGAPEISPGPAFPYGHSTVGRIPVPLDESERMINAVTNFGGEARLTVYPKAKHDSWTETYNNDELYEWMLTHKRQDR